MATKLEIVKFRRKEKTDYRKRLRILLSRKPRIVIRKSLKHIYVQGIRYNPDGDRVLFTVSSKNLEKLGWKAGRKNLPSAYLTGLLAGKKAVQSGIKDAVLDIGIEHAAKGGKLFAALKGIVEAGVKVPHSDDVLPADDRIAGQHIAKYAKTAAGKGGQFSLYAKNSVQPDNLQKIIAEMKNRIMGMQ
jgi:large subunit ribosomal protein L18